MANNTFNIDDYLTPAPSVGNSPEQSQQFQSFNIDDYLDITDKDITGLGKKQAAEFGNQLAKFSNATPVQQYQAFEKYGQQYQNHLAQQGYSPTQIAQALTEFNANADPRNQTGLFEYYIGDRGNDVMIGTGNLIGDALAAVPEAIPVLGQWADNAEKYVKNTTNAWQNDLSAKNQINAYLGEKVYQDKRAEGASEFSATLSSLYENPMQVTSLLTQQVPQLLLGAAGTATLAGANIAGYVGRDRKAIEEAYEKTLKENPEQLLKLPEIQERMAQGMTLEQAVNDAKTDVSDNWKSILTSALLGGTEALSPLGKFGQGVNRGVLKTLGKEVGQEALQEGAEQLNSNLAVGEIDGKTGAFDEVVRNATLGAVAGLGTGIPTAIEAGLNGRTESDADIDQILNRSAEGAKTANAQAKAQGESQQANSTNTQSTTGQSSVDEQILESVVSEVADEELRNQYFDELKSSIQDGSIVQAAEQNTAFGRFAKSYMDQTQAKAGVEPQQAQTEQTVQTKAQVNGNVLESILSTYQNDEARFKELYEDLASDIQDGKLQQRLNEGDREYANLARAYLEQTGQLQPQQAVENPQNVVNQPTAAEAELQQTANVVPTQPRNVLVGASDTVDIGENNYQPFQYEVMEAEDLLPTQQKAGNQLRDRERTASQAQVNKIARNLDPRKLVDSPTMDMGAPLLAQDGKTVIAGNGRSMALRQAYQEGNADGYKQYLQANAGKFGLDANQIAGMKNPVLVRRLNTAVDIKQTAINSNEQGGMRMSNLEQAKVDAGRLPNMASFELGENGEINTTANQVFISQFIQNQPETLRNELLDGKGNLSQTGVQRLRNAMLYTAYGDTDTLARAVESTDQGARNIINALTRIAPKVAQVKQDIANGALSDVDISADIVSAVEKYNQLRSQNKDVGEYLQQQDFVSELTPEAKLVLRIFNENNRSARRISDILTSYYNSAETQGNTAQSSMFGDVDFDKAGTLEQAKNTDDIRYSQSPKSTEENIARGSQAMEQAIQYHQDVQNAMFRDGVGWIDFIWGTEGVVKESGKTKGAKGVSHIIEARMRKDNLSYAEAVAFLTQQVPDIIANGRIERDYEISGTRAIAIIRTDGSEVHLIKKGSDNAWLLTGFEPKENQQMNQSRGATTSDLRSNSPIRSRTDEGAVGTDNVQQSTPQRNRQIAQDQQTLSRILGEETASHIQVVDRNTKVPSGRDVKQLATKGVEGWFEPSTQKLYIISDNITANDVLSRDERLAWVAFHELAHAGVRIKYGHLLTNVLASASQNVVVKVLARKIQAEHGYEREIAIEEAMMEIYAAYETGNWAELESRYKTKIHESYKQGKNSVGDFLTRVANALRRLIGGIIGKDLTQTMTTSQVFDTLRGIQQGINDIAKSEQNQTASENGNIRYSFAGEKAQTANHSLLEQAKSAVAQGQDPEVVRQQTGWFTGADGKWRFEIDDSQVQLKPEFAEGEIGFAIDPDFEGKSINLEDLIDAPELFSAYPDLRTLKVDTKTTGGSFYSPSKDTISLAGSRVGQDARSSLLHEIQHAIQERENFARGGNSDQQFAHRIVSDLHYNFLKETEYSEELQELATELTEKNINAERKLLEFSAFEAVQRLRYYANSDNITRSAKHILGYAHIVDYILLNHRNGKLSLSPYVQNDLSEASRASYRLPKRTQKGYESALRHYAMEVADAIESSISSDTLTEFKADPRSTKAINNALSRAFHKSIKELSPVKEAQQKANRAEELWRKHIFSEPYDIYLALSGEVEARNVQARMDMTAEERRRKSPQSTEDVSREHQIPVLPDNVGVWRAKSYSLNEEPSSENSDSNLSEAAYNQAKAEGKTELTFQQWKQVRSPEFKAWFGDWENDNISSDLLDGNGEPKIFKPELVSNEIHVTKLVKNTTYKTRRVKQKGRQYVKYDEQGNIVAYSSKPKEGFIEEEYNYFETVKEPVESSHTEDEKLTIKQSDNNELLFNVYNSTGKNIGYLSLWRDHDEFMGKRPFSKQSGETFLVPYKTIIDDEYQRMGIGQHLYRFAEQTLNEEIYPAKSQTDKAKGLWNKRYKQGNYSGYYLNEKGQIKSATDNNGQFSSENDDIRFSLREDPNSEFAKQAEPKRRASSFDEARAIVSEFLGEPLVNKATGMVATVSKRSLEKLVSGKAHTKSTSLEDHLLAVANIDSLFENAVQGWVEPHKTDTVNIAGMHKMFAPLLVDDEMKLVKITVKEMNFNQGNKIYSVETIEVENEIGTVPEMTEVLTGNSNIAPHRLHGTDTESLIQRIKDFNSSDENSDNIRYSVKQSVDDLAKTGKAKQDASQMSKLRSFDGFKSLVKDVGGWLDERVTDGLRPVNDWIDTFKQSGISDHEAERLKDDMYRAKGVRDALNSELESAYLNPIIKKVAAIAKANKMDELSAKRLAGYWISGRYAIEKNNSLLKQDHQAMLDAEKALNEANANGDEEAITLANREYRKAERQYRYRKHDVELALDSDEEFQVGTAGGWSNAEAANFMQNIEKHIPKKDLETLAELVYDLNQKRLEIDHQVGRYTEEQYNEYKANRHYVPLTGDPNADDDFDGISGAGSNALNVSKDRALKGRKLSEAEDGIDASWRAIGKSTTYAGWADFKNRIDFIYETKVDELVEKGYSTRSAREEVENTLGISKSKMKGLTRSNDDVLIRKVGGEYFEYRLPQKVMQALKNDNVEHANAFLKVLSKPTSWYARGVTQWTITFAPMNMMRDAWEKSEFIRVQKLYDKEGNLLDSKTMDKIGRAVLKNAFLDKSTWAATKRLGFNQTLRDSGSEGLLKQLLKDGGVSTYSTYLAKTETDLIKKLKAENNPIAKKLEQAGALLEGYNKIFDNVSALSAYKALIDHGVDPKQAAAKTLELTNFRKTGSKMRGIKALYMFSQPTAMGARNLIKYLSTPKGQKRFIGYMAVMMPLYAALRALDDDDEGGNKMDQLGDITRYIPLPMGLDKYFKIPVGFGMPQMAWNFSVNMVKAMQSDMPLSEAATNMFVHSMKTFAPISPSEISAAKFPLEKLALTATPTILQPLMQNVLNRSAFGSQITTNFVRDDKLKSEQSKATTAQFWKDVAVELNDVLGIDMHPEQIKNLFDGYGSMLGSLKEVQTIFIENPNREQLGRRTRTPFLNQLIGTTNEFAIQSRYYEASEEAQTLANEYNSRKERGKLEGWLDAEKLKIVKWHERNKKLMANTTKEKSKLTRQLRSGTINANVYEARLKVYNQKMDVVQRTLLNQWREMQGLNTTKSR